MLSSPVSKRRRLVGPGVPFTFIVNPAIFTQEDHVWQTRLIRVLRLAYNMSYNFRLQSDLNMWVIQHAADMRIIQNWLGNVVPLSPVDDQNIEDALSRLMNSLPVNFFAGQNSHHVLSNLTLQRGARLVNTPESTEIYVTRDGTDNTNIVFFNVPIRALQDVVDMYHGAQVDIANSRLASTFSRSYDDLVEMYAMMTQSSVNGFLAIGETMQRYQPNVNVVGNYHDNLITLYGPARYYMVGFCVIGPNVIQQSPIPWGAVIPVMPYSYTLTPAVITQIQTGVTLIPPPLPFGPGAFTWLLLGVQDFLQNDLVLNRGARYNKPPNQQLDMTVTVNFSNGIPPFQFTISLKRGLPTMNRPNYYKHKVKLLFQYASMVFAGYMRDYYGEHDEDDNFPVINNIVITVQGFNKRPRQVIGSGIDGNNIFWENLLVPGDGRFKGMKGNFVLFKSRDEARNCSIHGCVQRAINCYCKANKDDSAVFCNCPLPECLESVDLETTKVLCKSHGDKFLIFVITISKADQRGHSEKNVELFYKGENYYSDPDGKVLYISMPQWTRVQGHCALWLPGEYNGKCKNEEYGKFLAKSRFNTVNEKITRKDEPFFCPICCDVLNKEEIWGHFLRHCGKNVCISCGLDFETEELLNVHSEYHCKELPTWSTIVLRDDPVKYHEPEDQGLWICVYADLESAILPSTDGVEREHMNILVGWVDDYNKQVRVARDIKEFLNSLVKLPTTDVIIYFHNGEGYDFHFIVRDLCDCRKGFVKDFSLVGDSGQKIRFFSVVYRGKQLHFRDSFAFVSESLEKWVKSSLDSGCKFPCFNATFDDYKKGIMLRKNPFPYNAIKCQEDLDRPIVELYGWATCDINEELFCYKYTKEELLEFANWLKEHCSRCGWKTVLDYYVDYLKCDVSQLKDVMDYFAENAEKEFHMNIHCYYGTPSLTWAAWLKQNKYELSPITESRHYDVINSTIRGGQTGVFTRKYEKEEEGGAMFDLDCNALYATVMLKFEYPCHDWREEELPQIEDLLSWLARLHSSGRSAFVELDLRVPENPIYNDYIPVASKRLIRGVYNYYAMNFYGTENPQTMFFNGLTQVVGEHKHYCCHSRNLDWYLKHGVIIVDKLHFILSGKDEPVFKEYVQDKLDKRKKYASDPIKKMLYKLLNNSLYGKTYEDETQRAEYCLEPKDKVDPENRYKVRRIINEMGDWVLYEHCKTQFTVNKPVYLGACITEFSKLWMYQFYYDKIKAHYFDARVYYTDTDALTIWFPTKVTSLIDVAKELNTEEEQIIDTSNFEKIPEDPLHNRHNNEPGLFKSETGDHAILKFIGLRAKTYIMVCDDGSIKMSVKGCPMKEKKRLTWDDFKRVLLSKGEGYKIEFDAIRSKFHMVRSVRLKKIVLSADDRKRYILPDLIHTLPLFTKEHLEAIQE